MNKDTLKQTAEKMVAPGKGILAIDESFPTIKKRFDALGVEDSEENRRAWRNVLIQTPGIEEYISGYILFDETMRQNSVDEVPFPEVLRRKGIITGIKVDKGAKDLAFYNGEKVTEGLDGLRDALSEYVKLGAQFAKWRAVITIGDGIPTDYGIEANAHAMGRYAALCQEAGFVPMVEPEILIDGDHSISQCYDATAKTLQAFFSQLDKAKVYLGGTILKVSMVLSGNMAQVQADVETVAKETVRCLKENVPSELAGIVFLSGGQSDELATLHLNEMNKLGEDLPWTLSFSYGRGIQMEGMKIWAENMDNIKGAQEAILRRARDNSLASQGKYNLK